MKKFKSGEYHSTPMSVIKFPEVNIQYFDSRSE